MSLSCDTLRPERNMELEEIKKLRKSINRHSGWQRFKTFVEKGSRKYVVQATLEFRLPNLISNAGRRKGINKAVLDRINEPLRATECPTCGEDTNSAPVKHACLRGSGMDRVGRRLCTNCLGEHDGVGTTDCDAKEVNIDEQALRDAVKHTPGVMATLHTHITKAVRKHQREEHKQTSVSSKRIRIV